MMFTFCFVAHAETNSDDSNPHQSAILSESRGAKCLASSAAQHFLRDCPADLCRKTSQVQQQPCSPSPGSPAWDCQIAMRVESGDQQKRRPYSLRLSFWSVKLAGHRANMSRQVTLPRTATANAMGRKGTNLNMKATAH